MKYRDLGNTGLKVSEIGFGAQWMEKKDLAMVKNVVAACEEHGINIMDCWMSEPNVRSNLGQAIKGRRDKWIIQGHIGSTWQNGEFARTRDVTQVRIAFEDLLKRLGTDYIDLGMIHYLDDPLEFSQYKGSPYLDYILELRQKGIIRHIGISTHNPAVGALAVESGYVEMIMFSINPAFDMMPGHESFERLIATEKYIDDLAGVDPDRAAFYNLCAGRNMGVTVMKCFAGGRLFNPKLSPFGIALTPVQCIHYALTKPAVCAIMGGYSSPEQVEAACAYEFATDEEKYFAKILAEAPKHAYPKGQCAYCGHCAPCPAGIDIPTVNKFYDLAVIHAEPPATVKSHYLGLSATAADCFECGICEERCPFEVNVKEKMKQVEKFFGK